MTLKKDEKFKKKLTCRFKIDVRNLANFYSSTQKFQKFSLWWSACFWPKYIMFKLKKYRGVIFPDTGEWCKISRGIDLPVENWHVKFNEFWPKHSKISKICPLMGCFWPKYIIFELTKYKGVTFDGTENWCKVWRKTNMCFQKWHEEFGNFSPEHSKV